LYLYETYGEDFAAQLNGLFAIAIWDGLEKKMLVVNDRLSNQPIYYALTQNGLIFASGVRAILTDASVSRQTDRLAIGQFSDLRPCFGRPHSFRRSQTLSQASVLTFRQSDAGAGLIHIHPY
jgi:asparagine synthase (glutamine-hydrolysing)